MSSDVINTLVNRLNGGPSSEGYVDISDGSGFIQLSQDGSTPSTVIFGIWESTAIGPQYGGTGINNIGTITVGGNVDFSGAHNFIGTLTGDTNVTFPTSGTLATTSEIPSFPLSISNGGTGEATAPNALTNLGALPIAGGTMTGNLILNANPTNALGAVTKQYADALIAGLTFIQSCYAATTANLNATYVNGASGIGATLTNAGSLAAFTVDGTTPPSTSRILVKNQSSDYQNGIYSLTTVGSGAVAWILTRTTDYDMVSQINPGDFILVNNGTANIGTGWVETSTVTVIGSTGPGNSIDFSQFGNPGTVTSVSGTSGQIDVATGTTTPVISIDAGYVGQSSITTLGTVTTGTWNATTVAVPHGGTGNTTFTAYSLLCAGTTATGTFQNVSGVGTSGQVLTSQGASTLPIWQTIPSGTVTSVSGTSGQIDVATGTTTPVISIDAGYVGQSSITTLGTVTTGTWNATTVAVPHGGTGDTSFTTYMPLCGGTSTTGAIQSVSEAGANAGYVLTYVSSSALPTWQPSGAPTGAALTEVNDTNVTLTLGGTPSTALLQATSITAGWSGTLSLARGGTAANLTASNGGIFYSTASAGAILSGTATADQVLLSGASGAPSWSTATYPATTTASQILYSSSTNVIAGLATANNGVLLTNGSGVPSIGTATVAVGGTGNTTFTAYSIICAGTTSTGTFQNVSGIGSSGQVLTSNGASALPTWQNPTSAVIVNQNTSSVTMVAGTRYFINNGASLVTLTLPASASQGDTFNIIGGSSGGWKVGQAVGQQINFDTTPSTSGTGGSVASTSQYNCVEIQCITANTTFVVTRAVGEITVV